MHGELELGRWKSMGTVDEAIDKEMKEKELNEGWRIERTG